MPGTPMHISDSIGARLTKVARFKILAGYLTHEQTPSELKALVQSTGGIDLLINNAGTSQFKSFAEQTSFELESLLKTNLVAPMLLTQALIPELMKSKEAQIINIGSIFGYIGFPGFTSYCASKFGLRGFSQSLRRELADTSIRVKYFAPRATKTSINSDAVMQMNVELKTESDSPAWVASEFMKFLESSAWEKKLGGKESFFVFMNQLFPSIPDKAILGQLPIIKKYLKR
jgi:short-subunit dehydrogenase